MPVQIKVSKSLDAAHHLIHFIQTAEAVDRLDIEASEKQAVRKALEMPQGMYVRTAAGRSWMVVLGGKGKEGWQQREHARRAGYRTLKALRSYGAFSAALTNFSPSESLFGDFLEGLLLSSYRFEKYKSKKKAAPAEQILLPEKSIAPKELQRIQTLVEANFLSRDLVMEPLSYLTAVQLSSEIKKAAKISGFKVQVFDKKKITSLGMGGLLAVNRGSQKPPTFNILEWKPSGAKNKKPIVLVGKGVVYDTGGLSLKPTPNSMDMMKCDMSGAAAVIGAMYAAAKMKLPVHVVGLIPATDNRPGEDAYVPGDVITISNGTTVEVLNTDAEGRLILADALVYASRYKPELVIDLATLTGAAKAAIGSPGTVMMGTAGEKEKSALKEAAFQTHERVVEFPLWEEYGDWIKSEVADIKNIGGPEAGAITAGKFLEHFTDYPWIHLDIAGTAYVLSEDQYRGKFATGVGVRMLFAYLQSLSS